MEKHYVLLAVLNLLIVHSCAQGITQQVTQLNSIQNIILKEDESLNIDLNQYFSGQSLSYSATQNMLIPPKVRKVNTTSFPESLNIIAVSFVVDDYGEWDLGTPLVGIDSHKIGRAHV